MSTRKTVRVTLVAEVEVVMDVLVSAGEDPTDLSLAERGRALGLAPAHPAWTIARVEEVSK